MWESGESDVPVLSQGSAMETPLPDLAGEGHSMRPASC
jgi:hypothetical protein